MLKDNQTYKDILASRQDISGYMFHFTKRHNAFETLKTILDDGELKCFSTKETICFTEAPLASLKGMFDYFAKYDNPMYAPFGIGIERDYFIKELKGKPVIYGDDDDFLKVYPDLWWRFEDLVPGQYDFTWLREWRVHSKCIKLDKEHIIVITKDEESRHELLDDDIGDIFPDPDISDREVHTTWLAELRYKYKGISIEEIEETDKMSKQEIDKLIGSRGFSETVTI